MDTDFNQFARAHGTQYFTRRERGRFLTFANRNDKQFIIPEQEVLLFLASWDRCRILVEEELASLSTMYEYSEVPYRSAAKAAIRESGSSFALQTIRSVVESQTAGTFQSLNLLVRCHTGQLDDDRHLALDARSLKAFLEAYPPGSELQAARFNALSRDSGNIHRSTIEELDAFTFANSNGKQFWVPLSEIQAFISGWDSQLDIAESILRSPSRPDPYHYDEPLFREAARAVVEAAGREIEMPSILPLLGSQTPGLFEVVDLLVRFRIGHFVARGSISLSKDALGAYLRNQVSIDAPSDQHSLPLPVDEQFTPTLRDTVLTEGSWSSLLEAAFSADASTIGAIWRANRDFDSDVEAIRDAVSPEQTLGFVKKHLGFCEFMISAEPRSIKGVAREASSQIQRFARRHEGALPATAMERLLSLAESAAALAAVDESERTQRRRAQADNGIPGIYVYALPHYLKNPVIPSVDDVEADRTLMKVGMSDRNTIRRFRAQQRSTELPEDPELLRIYAGDVPSYSAVEQAMHDLLRAADHRQARGDVTGTEWFLTSLKFLDAMAQSLGLRVISTGDSDT